MLDLVENPLGLEAQQPLDGLHSDATDAFGLGPAAALTVIPFALVVSVAPCAVPGDCPVWPSRVIVPLGVPLKVPVILYQRFNPALAPDDHLR